MYSSTLPSTSELDGGERSTSRPGRVTPGKDPVRVVWEAGWAPGAGLDGCGESRPPPGFDPRTVQPVASRYTDWAIPAPAHRHNTLKFYTVRLFNHYWVPLRENALASSAIRPRPLQSGQHLPHPPTLRRLPIVPQLCSNSHNYESEIHHGRYERWGNSLYVLL